MKAEKSSEMVLSTFLLNMLKLTTAPPVAFTGVQAPTNLVIVKINHHQMIRQTKSIPTNDGVAQHGPTSHQRGIVILNSGNLRGHNAAASVNLQESLI